LALGHDADDMIAVIHALRDRSRNTTGTMRRRPETGRA